MNFPAFIRRFQAFALCFAACLRLLMIPASAQVYEKMFSFTDARAAEAAVPSSTGSYPDGELVLGNDGNFYGTTIDNGFVNYGTVFRVTPAGVITTLAQFTGVTGAKKGNRPIGVTFGSDGNLYGTTYSGGQDDGMSGYGTIFRLTPSGAFTTLLSFSGGPIGGYQPDIPLTQGDDGFLYGSASNGLFRITPSGAYSEFSQGVGSFIPPPIGGRLIKPKNGS